MNHPWIKILCKKKLSIIYEYSNVDFIIHSALLDIDMTISVGLHELSKLHSVTSLNVFWQWLNEMSVSRLCYAESSVWSWLLRRGESRTYSPRLHHKDTLTKCRMLSILHQLVAEKPSKIPTQHVPFPKLLNMEIILSYPDFKPFRSCIWWLCLMLHNTF